MRRTTKALTIAMATLGCFPLAPWEAGAEEAALAAGKGFTNPFFAMETGTRDANHATVESQAKMLKELGYAGRDLLGVQGLPETLKALDAEGLGFFAVYTGVQLDGKDAGYDPGLKAAVESLKGRNAVLWIFVQSSAHKPSSPEGDARAVEILREISDMIQGTDLRVALYPHVGCWVERVDDAVRVAAKVDRKNVGATFNLCHWLKVDRGKDMRSLIRRAMPRLFMVTINGADGDGEGWDRLIQTLDRGSYDVYAFLKALKDEGYSGPVGLQGFGIGGDVHENLKRSMSAWREFSRRMEKEWTGLLDSGDLGAWREPVGEWAIVGDASKDPANERLLATRPGKGVTVNGAKGITSHLFSKLEHGDVEAHVEFMVPKGSNSGVYFQGRYEIQVLDSWGVEKPTHGDCGGIYQRWRDGQGFEGRAPRVNASRPPGEWQSFDVIFRAPRFNAEGKKTRNAVFVKVTHNGVVIHENEELSGPTRASAYDDEKATGPLMLQGDHGPVAYRNTRIRPLGNED